MEELSQDNSVEGVTEDTIIGAGDTLTKILQEEYGYKVYHDRSVYDMVNGVLDRNYAYTASGNGIDRILAENPSIQVVIDLHRDGLNENTHLVTNVNGKPTAKIMFLNGDFVRKTYIRGYLYNFDRKPRATLVEVGGQTNTKEEIQNAMPPLANILDRVINKDE